MSKNMNEETEVPVTEEDEKVVPPIVEEEPKSEEEEPKEEKEDFVKGDEVVPAAKYNQALRKLREAELEKRESGKQSPKEEKPKKPSKEEENDDIFKGEPEDDKVDVEALVEAKVKPVLERLNQKEAEERKNQRTAFFEEHKEYLTDSEAWQELLDELDNFNPNSKDSYYKQLTKAHRIISGEPKGNVEIEKKKREMASESASKGDGSQKAADRKSSIEERAERLAKDMPKGFVYKERK